MSLKAPPGPSPFGFILMLPGLLLNPVVKLNAVCKKYGPVIKLGVAGNYSYIINDKDIIRQILKTDYIKFPRGRTLDEIKFLLGNGIFASEHELWSVRRRLLKPAFHSSIFPKLENVLKEELQKTTLKFQEFASGGTPFEPEAEFQKMLFSATIRNLFAGKISADTEPVIQALNKILAYPGIPQHTFRVVKKQYLRISGMKDKSREEILEAGRVIDKFTAGILDWAINNPEECGTYLNILLNEFFEGSISREDIITEMKNIIFAGYDTTASALTWLIYSVSVNTGIEEKVLSEIASTGVPDYQNVTRLEYSKMVIKETLRLYPPAWVFHRISTEDFEAGSYHIPANSWIFISPFLMHRNPEYWDNPDDFYPERFEKEENSETTRFDYIPFGNGPHVCIGNSLANFQLIYSLAYFLPKFRFEFRNKKITGFTSGIGLKSDKPLIATIRERK